MARGNTSTSENDACFSPDSWPHEVIAPGLAVQAEACGTGRRQFVAAVVRQIPSWARGVLGTVDADVLADTVQEFCGQMIERRPDLAYVPGKGSKRVYLKTILRYVHYRTLRGWAGGSAEAIDVDLVGDDDHGGPAAPAEAADLLDAISRWSAHLPVAERAAIVEVLTGDPCRCPSRSVHHVRSCRGLRRLRDKARASGMTPDVASSPRQPRRTRVRRPNVRVVRRLGQRSDCQPPRSVPM